MKSGGMFWRDGFTVIASALVVVLSIMLIVPYLIDWSSFRGTIDARLSLVLGVPLSTQGPLDVVLLPAPRLSIGHIEAGDDAKNPAVVLDDVRLELSLTALLHGEWRFGDVTLVHPRLRLVMGRDGAVALPAAWRMFPAVHFDRVVLDDAAIDIVNGAAQTQFFIGPLDMNVRIDSLQVPLRGEGQVRRAQGPLAFHFSTGSFEDGRLRFKWVSERAGRMPHIDMDGALMMHAHDQFFDWALDGGLALEGLCCADLIERTMIGKGHVHLDARGLSYDHVDVSGDGEVIAPQLSFDLRYDFADQGVIDAAVHAVALDLAPPAPEQSTSLLALFNQALSTLHQASPARHTHVSLEAQKITLHDALYRNVQLAISHEAEGDEADALDVKAILADGGGLELHGHFDGGVAPQFDGNFDADLSALSSLRPLLATAGGDDVAVNQWLARPAHVHSLLRFSAAGFVARQFTLTSPKALVRGDISFTHAMGVERGRLFADVSAQGLEAQGVVGLIPRNQNVDLALRIDAQHMIMTGIDGAPIFVDLNINMRRESARLDVEAFRLAVADARIEAEGFLHGEDEHIVAHVQGERMLEMAQALRLFAVDVLGDESWVDFLQARAVALSPLDAHVIYDGQRHMSDHETDVLPHAFTLHGTARGTRFDVAFKDQGNVEGRLAIEGDDSALVLRQWGMSSDPRLDDHKAHVSARLFAQNGLYHLDSHVQVAQTDCTMQGQSDVLWHVAQWHGRLECRADDISAFADMIGLRAAHSDGLPFDAQGQWAIDDQAVHFDSMRMSLGDQHISGDMQWRRAARAQEPRFAGHLFIDHSGLAALAALISGPLSAPKPMQIWSDAPFQSAQFMPPAGLVMLHVDQFDLGAQWQGQAAQMSMAFAPHRISFADMRMKIGDGELKANMSVRRNDDVLALVGTFEMVHIGVHDGLGSARLSALFDISAEGKSVLDLITHMSGAGRLGLEDISISNSDPQALVRVIARAAEFGGQEARLRAALNDELARGPYRAPYQEFVASMGRGRVRVLAAQSPSASSLSYDLLTRQVDARLPLSAPVRPMAWVGPMPSIISLWTGTPDHLRRQIEMSELSAGIAALLVEQETKAVGLLEAEARERAAVERRQKGLVYLHQRQKEVADFLARHHQQRAPKF